MNTYNRADLQDKASKPIEVMQTYLRAIAQVYSEIPILIPTGTFDASTTEAVKEFQKLFELEPTGNIDLDTWDLIVFVYQSLTEMQQPAKGIFPYPNPNSSPSSKISLCPDCIIKVCARGNLVIIIQAMLNSIAEIFNDFDVLDVSGYYDGVTAQQVKTFQNRVGLPETGNVDKITWDMLADFYNYYGK